MSRNGRGHLAAIRYEVTSSGQMTAYGQTCRSRGSPHSVSIPVIHERHCAWNGTARGTARRVERHHACSVRQIMSTHSSKLAGIVSTTVLLAFTAYAHDHNALNGTWTLEPAKSDFAGEPVVQTGTVTINNQEGGVIVVSRSFVYEGATQTFFYNDSIGSENNSTIRTGKNLKTKAKWDHDVLKVTTTLSGAVTKESYTLAPDGTMLVSVERPERKPFTLVFQRQ